MPKGRPSKNGKELQFKTVAVPKETYKMISELAELEERLQIKTSPIRNSKNKRVLQ